MVKWFILLLLLFPLFYIPSTNAEASVTIVSNTHYTDSINYFIVGEVKNTGFVGLTSVKITAIFYDKDDTAIDASFAYIHLSFLSPGQKSSFQIVLKNAKIIPQIDHYTLNLDYIQTEITLPTKLILKDTSIYSDNQNYLHILGEVENKGNDTTNVKVYFTGYDNMGQVVLTAFTDLYKEDLSNGETIPFDLLILHERVSKVDKYILFTESNEYRSEVIPEFPSPLILLMIGAAILILLKRRYIHLNIQKI